jgi:CheY-like chemotaxis protein
VPGGRVEVTAAAMAKQVRVTIRPVARNRAPSPLHDEDRESLEMARQLLALCEGSLEVRPPGGPLEPFLARALLPAGEQTVVLVIDDNADTLRLLERYLEGSRYRFAGTRDPQQAVSLAEEVAPRIIILDVMLPGVDGWELLGRLREHPKTGGVPIVVCTILPQERLALTLGAVAFMRKPVSQLLLLAVLDRQLGLQSPGSC